MSGLGPVEAVAAGPAVAAVAVVADTFSLLQALVVRVYEDADRDGVFTSADRPLAHARVITSTGQASITDPYGLYNIPSLRRLLSLVSALFHRERLGRSQRSPMMVRVNDLDSVRRAPQWAAALVTPAELRARRLPRSRWWRCWQPSSSAPPPASSDSSDTPAGTFTSPRIPGARGCQPPHRARRKLSFRSGGARVRGLREGRRYLGLWQCVCRCRWAVEESAHPGAPDPSPSTERPVSRDSSLSELLAHPCFCDTSQLQEFATANSKLLPGRLRTRARHVMVRRPPRLAVDARDGGRWSSYQRHLTGTEARVANARGDGVTVRAAERTRLATRRYARSGPLIGLLRLTRMHVRAGTETIALEVRDRRLPERICRERCSRARWTDQLQPSPTRRGFLRRHVGGLDSALNLAQIVTYQVRERRAREHDLQRPRLVDVQGAAGGRRRLRRTARRMDDSRSRAWTSSSGYRVAAVYGWTSHSTVLRTW